MGRSPQGTHDTALLGGVEGPVHGDIRVAHQMHLLARTGR
jgi:hypothetical protein